MWKDSDGMNAEIRFYFKEILELVEFEICLYFKEILGLVDLDGLSAYHRDTQRTW